MYTQHRTLHRHSAPCSNSTHAHSIPPGAHKCAPTRSYSSTHTCAGPAAPLTLRTAGDTAQCSGTCLTRELSLPDPQEASCTERRTQELNSLSLVNSSQAVSGLAGRRGTRAMTDVPAWRAPGPGTAGELGLAWHHLHKIILLPDWSGLNPAPARLCPLF